MVIGYVVGDETFLQTIFFMQPNLCDRRAFVSTFI